MNVKSLIDPNHRLNLNENTWVIAILRNPEEDPNHAFLMIEGVDTEGKLALTRYDCMRDSDQEDKFRIDVDRRVVDPKEGQKSYLDLTNNQAPVGTAWFIDNSAAISLIARIEKSKEKPDNYNELGNTATAPAMFPRYFGATRGLSDDKKAWLKTPLTDSLPLVTTTRICLDTPATVMLPKASAVYLTTPDEVKEAITKRDRRSVRETEEDSSGRPGNNSFIWARNMLYSLKAKRIINDLPKKPLDLKASFTNYQLPDPEQDRLKYIEENQFKHALEFYSSKQGSNQDKKYDNVILHLNTLKGMLEGKHRNNPSAPFLTQLFAEFTTKLNKIHDDKTLLQRIQSLADSLDNKANEFKLHEPINAKLKAAICGTIGAIVGFITGAAVGAAVTAWTGGFGALPGAIIGAKLGLSGGGIGGFLGTLFGFHNAKKKQQAYETQYEIFEDTKKEVVAMQDDALRLSKLKVK